MIIRYDNGVLGVVGFRDGNLPQAALVKITAADMRKELRRMAAVFNQGRPRKVSLKRPSPQMSRARLGMMRVEARINILADRMNPMPRRPVR